MILDYSKVFSVSRLYRSQDVNLNLTLFLYVFTIVMSILVSRLPVAVQ